MYNLNYTPKTLGVKSRREMISGGTRTKDVEYHFSSTEKSNIRTQHALNQRFPNWWVASRFVVGRETFLKCDSFFFNYIKIKNHKKWESEKIKQN
jgi:hypothetical protein